MRPARLDHWIDGVAAPPASGQYRDRLSPVDSSLVTVVADGDASDVDRAVSAAARAATSWRTAHPVDRGRLLMAVANRIRLSLDDLAAAEIAETGKTAPVAAREIEGAAAYFEYYAGLVSLPVGDVLDLGSTSHVYTRHEPFGVVGVITPWNMPLNQAARACAPALAAGNTVVAKPSEFTSRTTVLLARICTDVGMPAGVLNVVLGTGAAVGEPLVRHDAVRKVALTGSVAAGRAVGRIAADRVIPLTLELGGKSANIVFADADLERAADATVAAFTDNAGQVCSAGTRLLVQREVHDTFVDRLVRRVSALDTRDQIGPLVTDAQVDRVRGYLTLGLSEGLTAATGGVANGSGNFVAPTVFTGATNDHRTAREEIFGPVLVVIPFDDESQAVSLANDSDYGLVAGVWTNDVTRALRIVDQLEVGQVFVNTWTTGAVQTPFGGHKRSGYGREKGIEALRQYQQVKSITVRLT